MYNSKQQIIGTQWLPEYMDEEDEDDDADDHIQNTQKKDFDNNEKLKLIDNNFDEIKKKKDVNYD